MRRTRRDNTRKVPQNRHVENGVPSESTLYRMEQGVDDLCLANRQMDFVDGFHKGLFKSGSEPDIICVDGKAMRSTVQKNGPNPDIVSGYSFNTGITLATEACHEKNNKITVGPVLLDKLNIAGHIVTADAISMQKDIIDKNGDFVIELIADKEKWGGNLTVVKFGTETVKKTQVRTPLNKGCMCRACFRMPRILAQ